MTTLNQLLQRGEICRCLRAKAMFYQAEGEEPLSETGGPFWCTLTQSLLGPDGEVADVNRCRPGRSCCETV